MEKISSLIAPVIAAAERNNPKVEGDYIDDEGFLRCGKCNTRKQSRITMPVGLFGSEEKTMLVPIICDCRKAAIARQEEDDRKKKEMEIVQKLRRESLMDAEFMDAKFQNFKQDQYNKRNLKLCKRYAEHFDEMLEKNQGLLFWGGVGTGKTFSAACIANYLLDRRVPVVMTSFIKLISSMKDFNTDDDALLRQLNMAKLLIIDDLGAERGSEYALEKVYSIVDSRKRAKLPMIVTTNIPFDQLSRTTDIRYSRIYDRIIQVCYDMEFKGPSWRKSEFIKRQEEMKKFLEEDTD